MSENPVLTRLKERKRKLIDFVGYLEGNLQDKEPIKISANFKHRRFDSKGFAVLSMEGIEMNNIMWRLRNSCNEEIDSLTKQIADYERSAEEHRRKGGDESLGSVDH